MYVNHTAHFTCTDIQRLLTILKCDYSMGRKQYNNYKNGEISLMQQETSVVKL